MPTIVLAKVRLASSTGKPKDDVVNDLFFDIPTTPVSTDYDHLALDIAAFFIGTGHAGQSQPIYGYLGRDRDHSSNACSIDFYELPPTPGPLGNPVASRHWTLTDPGSVITLPPEVAVCLSFHGNLAGLVERSGHTRPRARNRGRIFIGTLNNQTLEESGSGIATQTVNSAFATDLGASAKATFGVAAAAHDWTWLVFSRVLHSGVPVIGGYVDDAFDTQRRRGVETTGRTAFAL